MAILPKPLHGDPVITFTNVCIVFGVTMIEISLIGYRFAVHETTGKYPIEIRFPSCLR